MLNRSFLARLGQAEDQQEILSLLKSNGLDPTTLANVVTRGEPGRPYSRTILGQSEECEIMLANWATDCECAPHDHGGSHGFVLFLHGDFVESHFRIGPNGMERVHSRDIKPGTILKVNAGEIHSCRAILGGSSLHIYFPPIEGMRVYDLANREALTVASNAGAWLPQPENMVLSRKKY